MHKILRDSNYVAINILQRREKTHYYNNILHNLSLQFGKLYTAKSYGYSKESTYGTPLGYFNV